MIILIIILTIIISVLSYTCIRLQKIIFFMKDKQNGKRNILWNAQEIDEIEIIRKRVELDTLQSQINPHFLYNTLDSIRSKALLERQNEIADMTEVLARFFRYCIGNNEKLVKLREELSHIEEYFQIQKYRFEDRFDVEINIKDDSCMDLYLPKMTIQPLVENAMMHGLEKVNRKGKVRISVGRKDDDLLIVVSDNGGGIDENTLEALNNRLSENVFVKGNSKKSNGIAIYNVNARLKLVFGTDAGILYQSVINKGTDAMIKLPVVDDFARSNYESSYLGLGNIDKSSSLKNWINSNRSFSETMDYSFINQRTKGYTNIFGVYDNKRNFDIPFDIYLRTEKVKDSLFWSKSSSIKEIPNIENCVRSKVGIVPCNHEEGLFEDLTISENLTLLLAQKKGVNLFSPISRNFQKKLADDFYFKCKISKQKRRLYELSDVEKKMLLISMWVVTKPDLLIIDRPYFNQTQEGETIIHSFLHSLSESFPIYYFDNDRQKMELSCAEIIDI